jgi:cytoskeleton protein RodZ
MNQPDRTQPDESTPREVGAEMARLRLQFGLSPQAVSEQLHIRARYITAMEEGRYDLMPAKAYARGYMHSYAEFLGMDADEVVARCFAQVAAPSTPPPPATRRMPPPSSSLSKTPWRSYAITAIVVLGILLLATQLTSLLATSSAEQSAVAPVPDTMLSSVRTIVMPTAENYTCLTDNDEQLLSCFHADASSRALGALNLLTLGGYSMTIDIADLILDAPEPMPEETPEEEPAEEPDA